MRIHLNIKVSGRVQGVFFRHNSASKAIEFGISGFVRNEPDGSVYLEIEGEKKDLDGFVAWCRSGPPFAKVEKVGVIEGPLQNFKEFVVER